MRQQRIRFFVQQIIGQIAPLTFDEKLEFADQLEDAIYEEHNSDVVYSQGVNVPALFINRRFSPIETKLLLLLKEAGVQPTNEEDALRHLWPEDASRILQSGTPKERRGLKQRLAVRVGQLNDKLRRFDENWQIIRSRVTDKIAVLYLAGTE